MAKNHYKLEGSSIISMIDQLNQYKLGNVTHEGLLQSIKELEAELGHVKYVQHIEGDDDAYEQYLADDEGRSQLDKDIKNGLYGSN
jgi:hypothetical protein